MRRLFFGIACAMCMLFAASCSKYSYLYEQTDYFVEQLTTTYQSYGLQGLSEKRTTKDGKYSATPMGRLIIVKIEEYVSDDKYESLRKDLERHYKNDRRVNRVYINQGGTVVIDCRN
ncbi:MAG: ABC transporter [Bacteroidales bacterium]|nr:ABC transporter [Bacteroidales bacterium]MDY6001050.1 ABC transporter [Candidatus Cryptobacteroides sp.]